MDQTVWRCRVWLLRFLGCTHLLAIDSLSPGSWSKPWELLEAEIKVMENIPRVSS